MRTELRIALRYIFSFRDFHFINIISMISIFGIIIGVTVLICVQAIFNGFGEFSVERLISVDPHVRIEANIEKNKEFNKEKIKENNKNYILNYDSLISKIKASVPVLSIRPALQSKIAVVFQRSIQSVTVSTLIRNSSIQDSSILQNTNSILSNSSLMSNTNFKSSDSKIKIRSGVAVGIGLANSIGCSIGDTLTLITPRTIEKFAVSIIPSYLRVRIENIYQTGTKEYDDSYIFATDAIVRDLLSIPTQAATSIEILLDDPQKAFDVKNKLENILGENYLNNNYKILTWWDLHRDLFEIMRLERLATFVILSIIIIIAVFNILASLFMTVIEKKSDIALLKSIGTSSSSIKKIFMFQGGIIGIVSSFVGLAIGLVLCYCQINFKWFSLDTSKYLIDSIPVSVHLFDVLATMVVSLGLSIISSIYPAHRAAKSLISDGLKNI